MKKTIVSACACLLVLFASAQKKIITVTKTTTTTTTTTESEYVPVTRPLGSELSIGLETGLALGNLRTYTSMGVGGTVKYAYNFDRSLAVTFQTGYIDFISKNVNTRDGYNTISGKLNIAQIPFKAGFRYSRGRVFVEPQLGLSILREKLVEADLTNSSSAFTYAGNIGVMATRYFEMSVRYEGMSRSSSSLGYFSHSFGYLGLRLAYDFPIGKK